MNGLYTIGLLVVSNIFMTFAWYGHIKLQQMKRDNRCYPLYVIILLSWLLALAEYTCQVPANRLGYVGNGGSFSLMQLKRHPGSHIALGFHSLYGRVFQW